MTDAKPPPDTVLPGGRTPLLAERFDATRVTGLRHAVASCAGTAGLAGERLDDFVLAVNELLTNAVRHGGGQGRIRLWHEDTRVVCEVSDTGAGLDHEPSPSARPALDIPGGWGLWLVERLTDAMDVRTGADGTSVTISTNADASPPGH